MNNYTERYKALGGLVLLFVAFMVAILLITPLSSAEDTQAVEVSLSSGNASGTIDVNIDKNPGILSLVLSIDYDSSVMTLKEVMDGGILSLTPSTIGNVPYTIYGEGTDPNTAVTKTGVFATLVFELKNGADAGQYPVYVTSLESVNADLDDVEVITTSGVVSIGMPTLGDVDGNGKINSLDSLKLKRFLANDNTVSIVKTNSDVNGDGKINSKDSLTLRRYLAGNKDVFATPSGNATLNVDLGSESYVVSGIILGFPVYIRSSDASDGLELKGNGTLEKVGDGLYKVILNETGCSLSAAEGDSYTVSFSVNGSGSVDKTSVTVPKGTTWSVSGNVLTFSDGTKVTANPDSSSAQYNYSFSYWSQASGTVTSDISIVASFVSSVNSYSVSFSVNDSSRGSVDKVSVVVPYGTTWSVSGNVLTFSNGANVTATVKSATSQYTYSFSSWSKTSGTVSSDVSVQAIFGASVNSYTVTLSSNNASYGTVDKTSVSVPYGTTWSVSGNVLTFSNGTKVTATVNSATTQYSYSFSSWSKTSGTVSSNTSVQAIFNAAVNSYTVTILPNNTSYGTVDKTSVFVPYGTTWSVSGNVLTFSNGTKVTATAKSATTQYTYSFSSWSKTSGTVTSNCTVQATFGSSVNNYTVSFSVNDSSMGTVDKSTVSVPYGSTWSVSGNVLTFSNGTKVTASAKSATAQYNYSFSSWSKTSGTLTSDTSVKATFTSSVNSYTVSFGVNDSSRGTVDKTSVTVPYGTTWSVSGNVLTLSNGTTVTATAKSATSQYTYSFYSWSNSSGTVTSAVSVQATFNALVKNYTVSVSSNNTSYGTVDKTSVSIPYGTTWSVSGNVLTFSNGTKVTASVANSGYMFTGWSKTSGTVTSNTSVQATFDKSAAYTPSFLGTKSYIGTYNIDGTTYYLVYDGTMDDVIVANRMANNSLYLDSNSERCTWSNKSITNGIVTTTVGNAYGGYSWSNYSLSQFIESSSSLKSSIQSGLQNLGTLYKGSFSTTHTYGPAAAVSLASNSTQTSKTFNGFTVGKYVSYAIVGDVDVFTAYYLSNGVLYYIPVYSTYNLESKFVEFSGSTGCSKSLSKSITYSLSGSGTYSYPYLIYNLLDLNFVRSGLSSCYKLMSDIDATPVEWTPIGWASSISTFTGTFDGNGHKISYRYTGNAYKDSDNSSVGLFMYSKGTIKNLAVNINLNVTKVSSDNCWTHIGGITSKLFGGTITNCTVDGSITTDTSTSGHKQVAVGGISGTANGSYTISKCVNNATLKATGNTASCGGMVGHCFSGSGSPAILGCLSTGVIVAKGGSSDSVFCGKWHDGNAGGIVGSSNNTALHILNCYVTSSKIEADNGCCRDAGGIIGRGYSNTITVTYCEYVSGSIVENGSTQSNRVMNGGTLSSYGCYAYSQSTVFSDYKTYIKNNP